MTGSTGEYRWRIRLGVDHLQDGVSAAVTCLYCGIRFNVPVASAHLPLTSLRSADDVDHAGPSRRAGLPKRPLRGTNTHLRLLTRRADGYHSADALIAMADPTCGGLCSPLSGDHERIPHKPQ